MDTKHTSAIAKAKTFLLVQHPYFGALSAKVDIVIHDSLSSNFSFEHQKLLIQSSYFEHLNTQELASVIAHQALVHSVSYHLRQHAKDQKLWFEATAYVVSDILTKNGFELPIGIAYQKRFSGMYTEEVYAILSQERAQEPKDVPTPQEPTLQEQLFANTLQSITKKFQKQHELPKQLQQLHKSYRSDPSHFQEYLYKALEPYMRDDFTIIPPNKKLLYSGIYLPSSYSQTYTFGVAIDTSGSIDTQLLTRFISELEALLSLIQNYTIELFLCDWKISSHTTYSKGEQLLFDLKGGGGTDFRPVFEYIEDNNLEITILFYFSDLAGTFPKTTPRYDVVWVTNTQTLQPPFGSCIYLDHDFCAKTN